ncbi:MAG: outer membrane lipoprotein carrier protein LolA [Cycloclasticus sp. symbiont of Poecilosclerida sp. M]|nr:MAG: outer membrane lipoprotein carrier protein LolA [Cycloclasticus sp. symbiont of Poecilosclerida sp. M]
MTFKYFMKHSLLIILLLSSSSLFADTARQMLENFLDKFTRLHAEFTQIIVSENNVSSQSATGEFWVKKPGQFRWNYTSPYVQKIVSNGLKVWFYDEDLEQVTIKNIANTVDTSPLSVILGGIPIEDIFTVEQLNKTDNLVWLKLVPKKETTSFESIEMGFKSGLLNKMNLHDQFGQTTRLLLSNVSINTPIDEALFEFSIPKGADVFEE